MSLEGNLKMIKDAKLDIELLRRKNETECAERNAKITKLQNKIILTESKLEEELKSSGQKKLECKLGWCSFRVMPDKWSYDIPKLIKWAKEDEERREKYIKVVEEFKKAQLKKDYKEGKNEFPIDSVKGLDITPQDPKFSYKLNGGI